MTVAAIHRRSSDEVPDLGIATVYRTLKLLIAQKLVELVELPGEEPHYECAKQDHHHHFRCLDCDRWFELAHCPLAAWDGVTLPEGFLIEGHHLTLYGRCPACADRPSLPPAAGR